LEREYITHLRSDLGIDLALTALPAYWTHEPPTLEGLTEAERWQIVRTVVSELLGPIFDHFRSADEDGVLDLVYELISTNAGSGHPLATAMFAEEVVSAPIVIVEQSPPSGQSLASLAGAGGAALISMHTHDPLILVWGLGALVVVRVADPVLAALGDVLAARVRGREIPTEPALDPQSSELDRLRQKQRTLTAAIDVDKRSIAEGRAPSHVYEDFLAELEAVEEEIRRLEDPAGPRGPHRPER